MMTLIGLVQRDAEIGSREMTDAKIMYSCSYKLSLRIYNVHVQSTLAISHIIGMHSLCT